MAAVKKEKNYMDFKELKTLFKDNKNISKCAEYIKTQFAIYPETLNISGSVLLSNLGLDTDNKIKEILNKNQFLKPDINIHYKLYPLTLEYIL